VRADGGLPGCEPCCRSPTAKASPGSPETCSTSESRSTRPTDTASTSPATGVQVGSVTELTRRPALVGGQVKTFHPAVYAGILARRDVPDQLAELEANSIGLIDIVVVNVAPFAPAVGPGSSGSTRRSR
jgi:AICAR transformylase/IMP cyclohydrolase PurH